MKESIGSTASLNIVLTFIAIVFAFLAASLSYYKAFKINNIVKNSIEKFEGYNELAISEINNRLTSLGYQRINVNCDKNEKFGGQEYELKESGNGLCIYFYNDSSTKSYKYGVVSYMSINMPFVGQFLKIPIKTTTDYIYGCYGSNITYGDFKCN